MVKIDQSLQYEKKEEKRSLKEYPCRKRSSKLQKRFGFGFYGAKHISTDYYFDCP